MTAYLMALLIWGGGYVAYRNPQNWLYITGNLKTREVIDIGLLNQPEYIRTDLRNVCGDFTYDSEFVSVDDIVEIFLESSVCHLFEIRKWGNYDHICSA